MLAPKHDETPVQYWISFWPTAPLFGVKWRFEGVSPVPPFFNPLDMMSKVSRAGSSSGETGSSAAAEVLEQAVETTRAAAEAMVDAATGVTQMMADEAFDGAVEGVDAEAVEDEAAAGVPPLTLFAAPPAQVDDLKQIEGVGPKLEKMLNEIGIYRLDQIASFSPENLVWVDANLTAFKGRSLRDDWVAQAKALL